jgi:hypothetical protein
MVVAGPASVRADMSGAEAIVGVETLNSGDIRLEDIILQGEQSLSTSQFLFSATTSRIQIDYTPAPEDFVSQPMRRVEDCSAAELTVRFNTNTDFSPFAVVGGYRGFTDYRSVWLDEYYRQLFAGVPGYTRVTPQGWHAIVGGRWSYVPGTAILKVSILQQDDTVSPGYEPQIGQPLLRGREYLRTTTLRISTENVVSPTVRTSAEVGATATTGREMRYFAKASINWSMSNTLTMRTELTGVYEGPAFYASSASLTLERDWKARWFAGMALRGYHDDGEVIDPLISSSAAPALSTIALAASLRWQGERMAIRLEGGPYLTRYDEVGLASAQFARLYQDRDWRQVQGAASWRF